MKYWPLHTRKDSLKRAYLFLDGRGLGILRVDRPRALTAMRALQAGELPEGAVLFPNRQLLRVRSHHDSAAVTVRLHKGKTRRLQLRSVQDRDQLIEHLGKHPAVWTSATHTTPILQHSARQLALIAMLGGLFWMSYQTALTTSSGEKLATQLAIFNWGGTSVPALPYLVAVVLLAAAAYSLWWPRRSREVDEILFQ
ncbi:hypothetical protein [Neolewinella sp.]|uniref:hypothetical protein n=1 Tax=Neolewinella sp. TaxID=2993543 RepID=UPI003B52A7E8